MIWLALGLLATGCGPSEVETGHGRSRGSSVNGTAAFAALLRERGHEVRAAVRTTDTLGEWADVIVRFAVHPGLPDRDESVWLYRWLRAEDDRRLVYVALDFDAESEFWEAMLAAEPKDAKPEVLERIKQKRDLSKLWAGNLPARGKTPARDAEWFTIAPQTPTPTACMALDGPWAEGVDARGAAISRHTSFQVAEGEPVLLSGDGFPLAISWTLDNDSEVLALANASFLVNAALLNRARRPLTARVADWIGESPLHVAFVEGERPTVDVKAEDSTSIFWLFRKPPFNWISFHLLGFGLLLTLSQAVRLGRARPEPPSGVERPSAHPEALGALLARSGRADAARALLDAYRRWRHPALAGGRPPLAPTSPR